MLHQAAWWSFSCPGTRVNTGSSDLAPGPSGLVLVLIFSSGGSLIPCILFHSANNCLTAFGSEGGLNPGTQVLLNVILIVLVLGGYLLFLSRSLPQGAEDRQR